MSFGFVMFGLLHTYFEYELQGDYDTWTDFVKYGSFLILVFVATFFWLKKGFFNNSGVMAEDVSEKRALRVPNPADLTSPEFKCFNLVYIVMLLGVLGICVIVDAFVESRITIMVMAFIPLLRCSQYLSQLIHICYMRTTKGVSLFTAFLMFLAPFLEAVAIWKYLASCEGPSVLSFVFIFQNVPMIIISFLTVTKFMMLLIF